MKLLNHVSETEAILVSSPNSTKPLSIIQYWKSASGGINHMVPCLCRRAGRGLQSLGKWVSSFPHHLPPNHLPSVCGISVHPRWDCHQESKLWYRHSTEDFNVWGGWLSILDYYPTKDYSFRIHKLLFHWLNFLMVAMVLQTYNRCIAYIHGFWAACYLCSLQNLLVT